MTTAEKAARELLPHFPPSVRGVVQGLLDELAKRDAQWRHWVGEALGLHGDREAPKSWAEVTARCWELRRSDEVLAERTRERDTARRECVELTALARDGDYGGPSCARVAAEMGWGYLYPEETADV